MSLLAGMLKDLEGNCAQRMRFPQIQDQLTKLADQLEDQDVSTEVRNLTERLADLEHQAGSDVAAAII